MALPIEDYAIIGDTQTVALVGKDGSIEWLCLPRFDSDACFASLLGDQSHGRWRLGPTGEIRSVRRRYRPGTLVLETAIATAEGEVRLVDFMPIRGRDPDVVRIVEGVRGRVEIENAVDVRFGYGSVVPWIRPVEQGFVAIGGPEALFLTSPVGCRRRRSTIVSTFSVSEGERVPFVLTWHPSHLPEPRPIDALAALDETVAWWTEWSSACSYDGDWAEEVRSSLVVLKALTYAPTGGIIAAATTSLPEHPGGVRNWDYRYCWLRDATFTLYALALGGYGREASDWRDWLLRAVAGDPAQLQIMYGAAGERRLTEFELTWLPGYEGSKPVRVGNAAVTQLQLDVYGEVMDALHVARRSGLAANQAAWDLQRWIVDFVDRNWREPDEGIWEVRGPRRDFTHSKVMAWVAVDRAVKAVERFGLEPHRLEHWKALRREIHEEVCARGFDAERGAFTQFFGSKDLDASLLMMPLVGFLPAHDPRVRGTIEAIERELCRDGLILRYPTRESVDGLPPGEGAFLACTFWLADGLQLLGRYDEARALFERLLALRNDVGLLAEEWDPRAKRFLGNFPQAFSHVGLINTARNLSRRGGPAEHRKE
jgi:GH15 family glucan-1,4-alpha-glucosidase